MEGYDEEYRPQYHFTYRRGWLSDINGLVHDGREYHLFSQHNPAGPECDYANMHWGHAVSEDLVHWRELPPALKPDREGPIFSGTCVVDWENTSGLQTGDEKVMVAFYTAAGYMLPEDKSGTQCMAYSNDRGRTWTKYSGNPVVENITHLNRDPKVFWHEPTKKWIMVITLSCGGWLDGDYWFAFSASPDLKTWEEISRFEMPRGIDCPDLFELPLDGDSGSTRWVFWAGDGTHAIGTFDGIGFEQEGDVRLPLTQWDQKGGPIGYAAQTYSSMPTGDDRVVQISWLRHHGTSSEDASEQENSDDMTHSSYPGMPFDQQAGFPCELALRTFPEGVRLCRAPVDEIALLYGEYCHVANEVLSSGEHPLMVASGELFDIQADIELGNASEVVLRIRGIDLVYNVDKKRLSCMDAGVDLEPVDGRVQLRVLLDRTSIEIFACRGAVSMSFCLFFESNDKVLQIYCSEGSATVIALDVFELRSAWR